MRFILLSHLLLGVASAASFTNHANLIKRDNSQVCSDLTVSSNNGDRKVAIVIDSSGSMVSNDYTDLRIAAGRALNEFLISDSEAKDGKKADEVTVIDFDDEAYLDYPLGDPGNANSSFSKIDSIGGTYITSGVLMAIDQLTSSNSGTTDKRSAIVVFTDGEDYSTDELVSAIGNATALGIRVSFGFLDPYASSQPEEVLKAVRDSRGVYATITFAAGSQNFINYVLLNGLTYNDNPQGYGSQLLAGLAETQFISGSDTVTLKYSAEKNERVNFTITTITAGSLKAEVKMDGKSLGSDTISYYDAFIDVQAPSSGEMQLLVTADGAPKDSMFSVTTNSNVPIKNCTVGVNGSNHSGLSKGAKAGIGIGVTIGILGLLGGAGYFGYKHFFGPGSGNTTAPPAHGNTTSGPTPGNHSQPPTYGEKPFMHTDVYPVDPSSIAQHAPTTIPPHASPPTQMAMPPTSGLENTPMSMPPHGTGLEGNVPMSGTGLEGNVPMHGTGLEGSTPAPHTAGLEGGVPQSVAPTPTPHTQMPMPTPHTIAPTPGGVSPYTPLAAIPAAIAPAAIPMLHHPHSPPRAADPSHTSSPQSQHTLPNYPETQNFTPTPNIQQPLYPGGQHPMYHGSQQPMYPSGQHPMGQHPMYPGAQQLMTPEGTYPNPNHTIPQYQVHHPGAPTSLEPGHAVNQSPYGVDPSNHTGPAPTNHTDIPPQNHTDWSDFYDPDNCSCNEGPSDSENNWIVPPIITGGVPTKTRHRHRGPIPKARRSAVEKHHHHEGFPPDVHCQDANCPLNQVHACQPNDSSCPCACRYDECPITKRMREERNRRDTGATAVLNVVS